MEGLIWKWPIRNQQTEIVESETMLHSRTLTPCSKPVFRWSNLIHSLATTRRSSRAANSSSPTHRLLTQRFGHDLPSNCIPGSQDHRALRIGHRSHTCKCMRELSRVRVAVRRHGFLRSLQRHLSGVSVA